MTTEKTTISQKDPTNKSKKSTQNSKKKLTEAKKSIEPIQKEIEEVKYDLDNIEDLISLVKTKDEHLIQNNFSKYIDSKFTQYESLSHYELVFLYDRYDSINTTHSNNIYKAITNK